MIAQARHLTAAALVIGSAWAAEALGQTFRIYDNSANFLGQRTAPQNAELGDIVNFAPGTPRILHEFAFEYFKTPNTSGDETAQVFLRSVAPDWTIGPVIFQTDPFSIPSGFRSVWVKGFNTPLPETVAWTVKFSGFEGAEEAGLLYYNSPTVGSSATYNGSQFIIQQNQDGTFAFVDSPSVADNLGARFVAVPEVSASGVAVASGLLAFAAASRWHARRCAT